MQILLLRLGDFHFFMQGMLAISFTEFHELQFFFVFGGVFTRGVISRLAHATFKLD